MISNCWRHSWTGRCQDGQHTALGHLEVLKKKELVVLATLTMIQEEFYKLATERDQLIVKSSGNDHLNFDTPIPANELVVASSNCITNKTVDTSGNGGGGIMGVRGGVNSVNSYNINTYSWQTVH
jgi:hypothetical protein